MADTQTVELKLGWVGGGIYIALGIVYHLIFGDGPFSWGDPWLYVGMFLWPFLLFFRFLFWGIILFVVGVTIYWLCVDVPNNRRRKREAAANRARYEEEREERRRAIAKATPSE